MTASAQAERRWSPLADGQAAEDLWEAIFAVADDLPRLSPVDSTMDPSLGTGAAGVALFFSYLHLARPDRGYDVVARNYLDRAFELTATHPTSFGLFGGFVGVAWTAAHCDPLIAPGDAPTVLDEIDDALLAGMRSSAIPHFDLISGLTGAALYAFQRLPRATAVETLDVTIDELVRRATITPEGLTWHTPVGLLPEHQRPHSPEGHRDLGIAHGVAGPLGVLTLIHQCEVLHPKAHGLFGAGVSWLLEQRLPDNPTALFPYHVNIAGQGNGASRLAWCYGDLGIACMLWTAAETIPRTDLGEVAKELAIRAAKRPFGTSGVTDACLCHGAAGNGHLFHRLYRAMGVDELREASLAWFDQALLLRATGVGAGGFTYNTGRGIQEPSTGVIEGAAGIGLAMLACVTSVAPEWDQVLLISGHRRRVSSEQPA